MAHIIWAIILALGKSLESSYVKMAKFYRWPKRVKSKVEVKHENERSIESLNFDGLLDIIFGFHFELDSLRRPGNPAILAELNSGQLRVLI